MSQSDGKKYSREQTQALFVQQAMVIAEYWDKVDLDTPACQTINTQRQRIEGAIYSVFSMIDGAASGLPSFKLTANPRDPEDDADLAKGGMLPFSTKDLSGDLANAFQQTNHPDHELANFRQEYHKLYAKHMGLDKFLK